MYTKAKPKDFKPDYHIVSCFCEKEGKHIILQRSPNVYMPGKWGPPAGKIEPKEEPLEAIIREVFEETGIDISQNEINFLDTYYVTHLGKNFVYYVFQTNVDEDEVVLEEREHVDYRWVKPEEALSYQLIHDQEAVVKETYKLG
jgi:8-oxo-dGTP diphosphatase